tara:strand:- start:570 stop:2996 length:2427 start_codon:yes stop_codon:yes gene_type:complete
MSVAFLLKPNYNTINNVHHDFYDVEADNIKNSSLNQALEVSTSVSAPSHVVTGGTDPAQFYMLDATTLATDAPIFKMPIGQAPTFQSDLIGEFTAANGISVQSDMTFEVDSVKHSITGVDELTCGTLHYTTLDPAIPSDASAWSTFPATQSVDMAAQELTNCSFLQVKPVGGPLGLLIDNTFLTPDSAAAFVLQTDGDGSTIPAAISQFVLQPSNSANNTWEHSPSSLIIQITEKAVLSCTDLVKVNKVTGLAFVMNDVGAMSFNTDFNSGTPSYSFGTSGQLLSSNGINAPSWIAAPTPGDPSTWSEYPATQAVDLVSNPLTSSTDLINLDKDTTISKPLNTVFTVSATDSTSANGGSLIVCTAGSDPTSYAQFAMQCNSGKQDVKEPGGFLYTAGAGTMSSGDARELIFQGGAGGNIANASNIRFAYSASKKAYTINKNGALNFNADWNGSSPIIEGSFGTSGQIIASQGDALPPHWIDIPPTTSSQYVYYVSKDGTVGAAGDVNHPLSTIQAAITLGQAAYPRQVVILIAPGVYTETLSITLPNITLSGYSISQQQNLMTQIVGSVGVSCSASQDLFYSQVCFQNLQISGLLYDNSSVVHTLNVEGCRISANGAVFAQLSTADNRTRLTRCTILQASTTAATDPILKFSSGLITLSLLDVTARNNAPVLQFDGSAKLQACGLCTFESNTTSATAAPIVYIAPTSAAGYTYAFGYNSFSYASLVPRVFSSGKNCGIVCEAGTGHPTLIITYNTFNLLLCDATCFVVQDVKKADAAAYTDIRFFSNSSTYLATGIDSTHKTTLSAVA